MHALNTDAIKLTTGNHLLREQLKLKGDHFRDEISYLRKQRNVYICHH